MNKRQRHDDFFAELKPVQSSFLLTELEVFNWGPFRGMHRATVDPQGTAIIGPTGSGKTTLIDALMTLLVEQPRYNLASTGGHESDRTLISYVRGVLGGDGSNGHEEVARPANTITGLCATYEGGDGPLKLAALLWTDGSSNAAKDLKRRWIFSRADNQDLSHWLTLLNDNGSQALKRLSRDTSELRVFDSKKQYLAHTRKFFDVGDNAFTLLNRAAGLKQLNSIDDIFRDLVLEDRSAFNRALEVAAEFDNLAGIHKELQIARAQQESLVPIDLEYKKLEKIRKKSAIWLDLKRILPIWYAMAAGQRWQAELQEITRQLEQGSHELKAQTDQRKNIEMQVNTLREKYHAVGGNVIAELERTIDSQKERAKDIKKHADDYLRIVNAFNLSPELSDRALQNNQEKLKGQRSDYQSKRDNQHTETLSAHSKLREHEDSAREIQDAIAKVKERPDSNIPPKFQDFRNELAQQLTLTDTDLPFVAELVEVKAEESTWRGAIERALGAERLRILVPEEYLSESLTWVNQRDNRVHVRLQGATTNTKRKEFFQDGFCRKLKFKTHPLREAAKALIATRDRHCVDSAHTLKTTEHAMTIEGMMSGRGRQFDKQDQRKLHADWMTGFDNKDQLQSLSKQLQTHNTQIELCKKETGILQQTLKELDTSLLMIDGILKLSFSTIDMPGADTDLQSSQMRLQELLRPDSNSSKAKAAYDAKVKILENINELIDTLNKQLARLEQRSDDATEEHKNAQQRTGSGLQEDQITLAEKRLPIDPGIAIKQLNSAERDAADQVEKRLQIHTDNISASERRTIALMGKAQQADTGALAETGTELSDIPDYLEQLRVLNEEALPEKTNRFLDYLNRSSDQGVTQLLSGISEEVDGIEYRIAELNETLQKVDFKSERYLQLAPQRIKHERLRSLETAQRKLRSAALQEDQGQSHYRALQDLVEILRDAGENRRQLGSRALLDPRYRLEFYVVEVDRKTGDRSPPRTGSQSGSGGEKELMASHILTASLSYALCPAQASQPLYGTVVLDEAFSKSSASAAGRIVEALRIFNLHPIFVTPNKEIGLLKKHTRKVICVQRPGNHSSMASITWKQLDSMKPPPKTPPE